MPSTWAMKSRGRSRRTPRTVAMTVYGDLEVSALRELPAGRSPIATTVVPLAERPSWFASVWRRVREEVAAGHQAYVVCPRVGDPKEAEDADDVEPPEEEGEARRPPLAVLDVLPKLAEGELRREPGIPAPRPRRTREELSDDEDQVATPPRSRPAVAVADPARPIALRVVSQMLHLLRGARLPHDAPPSF